MNGGMPSAPLSVPVGDDTTGWTTVAHAAATTGVPASTVRRWLSRGELVGHRHNGVVLVHLAQVIEVEHAHRSAGDRT